MFVPTEECAASILKVSEFGSGGCSSLWNIRAGTLCHSVNPEIHHQLQKHCTENCNSYYWFRPLSRYSFCVCVCVCVCRAGAGGEIEVKKCVCVNSGFCHEVDENCALLGCYPSSSDNFLPTFWDMDSWPQKMGPIGCLETVRNYHCSLRNNPEEHSSQQMCLFSWDFFHSNCSAAGVTPSTLVCAISKEVAASHSSSYTSLCGFISKKTGSSYLFHRPVIEQEKNIQFCTPA